MNNAYGRQEKPKKIENKKRQSKGKVIKAIEGRIIRDIKNLFDQEEDYYKLIRVVIFWSNNYIEYESIRDRNKALTIKAYLDEIKSYLKDITVISKILIHGKFSYQ